jgi:NurA-like 5'-3' nuclease
MQWKRYDYLYDYMYLKNAMKILVESLNGFYSGRPVWSKIIAQNTIVKKLYEKMNKKVYKYMNQTDG